MIELLRILASIPLAIAEAAWIRITRDREEAELRRIDQDLRDLAEGR